MKVGESSLLTLIHLRYNCTAYTRSARLRWGELFAIRITSGSAAKILRILVEH